MVSHSPLSAAVLSVHESGAESLGTRALGEISPVVEELKLVIEISRLQTCLVMGSKES